MSLSGLRAGARKLRLGPTRKLTAYARHCFANHAHAIRFSRACQAALGAEKVAICIAHDVFALRAARDIQKTGSACFVADLVEIPSVQHRSGQYFRSTPAPGVWLLNQQHRRTLRCADEIITIGPAMADYISKTTGKMPKVIRNCLPVQRLTTGDQMREKIGLPGTARIVCLVNTLAPGYGLETTIFAIAQLDETVHLVCIGSFSAEWYRLEILAAISKANLGHRVHFLKPLQHSDYIGLISGADVGLLLLDTEIQNMRLSLPNRFFDFVLAGVPIISSDIQDVVTYLDHYGIGTGLRKPDPQSLAICITDFLDAGKSRTLRRGFSQARVELSWEREKLVFEGILARRSPKQGRVCILANKDVSRNLRIARMAKAALELGFQVSVLSRKKPSPTLCADLSGCRFVEVVL